MKEFKKLVHGKLELKKAFWIFWVVGAGIIGLLYTVSTPLLGLVFKDSTLYMDNLKSGTEIVIGTYLTLTAFFVWINTPNTKYMIWSWTSRIFILVVTLENVIQLFKYIY